MTSKFCVVDLDELDTIANEITHGRNVVQHRLAGRIARIEIEKVNYTPRALERVLRVFAEEWDRARAAAELGATNEALRRRVIAFLSALRAVIAATFGNETVRRVSPPRLSRAQRAARDARRKTHLRGKDAA